MRGPPAARRQRACRHAPASQRRAPSSGRAALAQRARAGQCRGIRQRRQRGDEIDDLRRDTVELRLVEAEQIGNRATGTVMHHAFSAPASPGAGKRRAAIRAARSRNAAVPIGANAVRSACFGTSCRNAPSFMRTSSPNSAPAVVPRNAGGTGRPAGEPGRPDGRARPSRRPRGSRPTGRAWRRTRKRRPVDERRIVGIGIAVRDRCDGIGRVHADSIGAVRCRMFRVDVKCRGAGIGRGGIATTADRQAADR